MVDRIGDYPWSSFPCFIGDAATPPWLSSRWQQVTGIRTRQAVLDSTIRTDTELAEFYSVDRQAPILGSPAFVNDHLSKAVLTSETEGHAASARNRPEPEVIDLAVADALGVTCEHLRAPTKGVPNTARRLAVGLSEETTGLPHSELADHYGYTTEKGVAAAARRYRQQLAQDGEFADLVGEMRASLTLGEVCLLYTSDAADE